MTELEWLKQESGLTDDELKAMEAVAGTAKFTSMLQKVIAKDTAAAAAVKTAEDERLSFENRYQNEYLPEMRKVTEDSIRAQGEAARLQAQLAKAKEYGIVVDDIPVRAPGSPDPTAPNPNFATKEEFGSLRNEAGSALAVMNDLNAEHFKLFGSPVPNMSELLAEVTRERTLGHSTDIRKVWESKHNVQAKRTEIAAADQKKHDDEIAKKAVTEYAQKNGTNPGTISPKSSRFSTFDPSQKSTDIKPWQKPTGMKRSANEPWRQTSTEKLAAAGVK